MIDKDLLKYVKGKRYYILLIIIFNIIGFFSSLIITMLSINLIEKYLIKNKIDLTILYLLMPIIIRLLVIYLKDMYSNKLANYVTYKLRNDTYSKYLRLRGNTIFSTAEMSTLSTEGIEQLRLYFSSYLPSFFYTMIAPIILFIIFMFINKPVAILYFVCIPLIPMSIIMVSKWAKKIFNKYWDKYIELGDDFLDNTRGMKELKIFLYDEYKQKEMLERSEEFRKITMKVLTMQLVSVTIMDLVAFGGAGVGIVLSLNAMNNGLDIYKTLFLILVGAEFFLPLRALGSAFHIAMNGATSGKKIIKLLSLDDYIDGCNNIDNISNINVSNLSFSYDNKLVLNNVSFNLDKGFYSLVGLSGSGKSTIAKLLSKTLIDNNSITINNYNINDINSNTYYKYCAYISNNTYIFNQSIYDSFKYYNEFITIDKMKSLLSMVKLDHLDLNFVINDSMTNISGGERQRLALAFYMTNDYDFYIFDEATSNIDIDSEKIIMDIIYEISKTKIVLFITHRLQNTVLSNKILYLLDGNIAESGSFNDLMSYDSNFKNLYELQVNMEVPFNEKA